MYPNVIALANGKGGVGKTSLAANVGGCLAAAGWHVLLGDLDPQGNLGRDLGYWKDPERDDEGRGLVASLRDPRTPLRVVRDVRPNLDVIVGGDALRQVQEDLLADWRAAGRNPKTPLAEVLLPVAAQYDITLLDCPPGEVALQGMGLRAARWVLIPARGDIASLDGLSKIGKVLQDVWEEHSELDILGVVLFAIGGKRMLQDVRRKVADALGDQIPVLATDVPDLKAPATAARDLGLLVHEYERDKVRAAPPWWKLRGKEPGGESDRVAGRETAAKLATEYGKLSNEVLNLVYPATPDDSLEDLLASDSQTVHR